MQKLLCPQAAFGNVAAALVLVVGLGGPITSPCSAQAPYLRFENLGTEDGLSQASVYAVLQDPAGFIWFGTQDGLNRWDGSRFVHYRHRPEEPGSLSDNRILVLRGDSRGRIWIGTGAGTVDALHPSTGHVEHYVSAASGPFDLGEVWSLARQSEDVLWIGGNNGLLRLHVPTRELQSIPAPRGERGPLRNVRSLASLPSGELLFGHEEGVGRWSPRQGDPLPEPLDLPDIGPVRALKIGPEGDVWVGADTVLRRLRPSGEEIARYDLRESPSQSPVISDLMFDRGKRLWVATSDGLFLRPPDRATFHVYRSNLDPAGLSDSDVRTVFEDRGGMIWVGSFSGGVDRWHTSGLAFGPYPSEPISDNDSTYSFTEVAGDVWIGARKGLVRWDRDREELIPYSPPAEKPKLPAGFRAMNLLGDPQGVLWIGTRRNGLIRLEPDEHRFQVFRPDPQDPGSFPASGVMSLYLAEDQSLYAGTFDGGLARLPPGADAFTVYRASPNGLSSNRIADVVEASPGELWLATYSQGLDLLTPADGRVRHFRHDPDRPNTLPADSVVSLHVDRQGVLWLGTLTAGFARVDRREDGSIAVRSWDESHGLLNNTIYGILSDLSGGIWVSTNRGVSRFDPGTESFDHYGPRHGLRSREFNFGANFQSADGDLFFGGLEGFNRIRPSELGYLPPPPPVALAAMEINNRPVPVPDEVSVDRPIELDHEDTSLSFTVAALDFWEPKANRYAYKLEGFDREWVNLDESRPIVYTNLDPGAYTFRARAANSEGVWNDEGLALPIWVAYAPWETWWALCLYAALATGLVYGGVRWRLGTLERRSEELRQLVDRRTAELKETVEELQVSRGSALEAKRRALKSLEEALEERRKAQEADQAKSIFLSNMSHELRTPLNAVLGFAQLMERDPGLTADHQESLRVILRSGEHLLRLINDVLSLAKIEAGRLTLSRKPFLLHQVCRDVEEMVRPVAASKGIELELVIGDDVPEAVIGDGSRLVQVLLNLMGNAVKFTEEGSVTLEVRSKSHLVELAVTDTGVGIPQEEMDQLFEPFQQTEAGRSQKEGTGLGLAISERLVELMGGTLRVDSKPGEGSTFVFSLPLEAVPADQVSSEDRRAVAIGLGQKPPKILVVDDAEENRGLLRRLFEDVGLPVVTAADGREAVELWRRERPSLVWMDMRMPVMDGYRATREIRRAEAELVTGRTVIIALSAAAFEDDRQEILEAGCDDIVTKPYQENTLFEKMSEHLDLRFVYSDPRVEPIPESPGGATRAPEPGVAPSSSDKEPSPGTRVLVAEDNPANQMVARRMLERLGHTVDVVAHGLQVLEAFEERLYPLVLMDIRMPRMNGVDATRELRKRLSEEDQPVIIALTGLASENERRICIEAGMDDLLAKPFRIEDLQERIERWLSHGRRSAPALDAAADRPKKRRLEGAVAAPAGADGARSSAVDRSKLALLRQLDDRQGRTSLATQVISLFLDTVPGQVQELQRAVYEGNTERWRRVAHSLKNSSATLGADAVSATCLELERLARRDAAGEETRSLATAVLKRLEREVGSALEALAAERSA